MINATIERLRRNRFLRFLVTGAVNSLFSLLVYTVAILLGAVVWLALLIAFISGMIFNFFSTGGYVFRDLGVGRVPRFVLCYVAVYLVNLQLIGWLALWMGNAILAQAVLTPPMAVMTYFLMSRLVFSTKSPLPSTAQNE